MAHRWKVLLVTSVAVFMSFLDVSIVNIAFPAMRASFPEASLADLSWVISAYNVVFAAALVPAGRLADRVGRKRAFRLGVVVAAVGAAVGGRLSDRYGQRVVAVPGILLFAAGAPAYIRMLGQTPNFVGDFLPAALIGGTGVGLSLAALGSAAVAELPARRYATGAAVQSTSRQLGAVLGISILVAVLGSPALPDPLAAFDAAWTLVALTSGAAAVLAVALGRVRARPDQPPDGVPIEPVPLTRKETAT